MATLAKRLSRVLLFAACTLVVARLACVRSFAEDRDAHVERLLAQLTLEEKIQQLQAFRQNGVARLGIPRLPVGETLHGLLGERGTSFPQAIALGSTWDPELIERVATAIAREARAAGVLHAFSPMLGLAQDPRWGRVEQSSPSRPPASSPARPRLRTSRSKTPASAPATKSSSSTSATTSAHACARPKSSKASIASPSHRAKAASWNFPSVSTSCGSGKTTDGPWSPAHSP
jgi:hypothetical protein